MLDNKQIPKIKKIISTTYDTEFIESDFYLIDNDFTNPLIPSNILSGFNIIKLEKFIGIDLKSKILAHYHVTDDYDNLFSLTPELLCHK